jgi:DNA repair protein RecN (Recombination protein N)
MLEKIYIKNFALIPELELDFHQGLNIITGETGAGKSIIVDALMLLLGERASTEYIRQGEKKAIIEGVFNIPPSNNVISWFKTEGFDLEDEKVIIRREITEKNSRAFINDTPVQINSLKKLGDFLVDFHGQHDHQILLKPESHIELLDIFAKVSDLKNDYYTSYVKLKEQIENLHTTKKKEKSLKDRIDYINFELKEIDKINPKIDEDILIENELRIKENAELLFQLSSEIYSILFDDENSVYSKLQIVRKQLNQIVRIDTKFEQFINDFNSILVNIEELSNFASSYKSEIDFDALSVEELRERYVSLKGLTKKYGSIKNAVIKREELISELQLAENFDDEIRRMEQEILSHKKIVEEKAQKLSRKRQQSASVLEKQVVNTLIELGVPHSEFKVIFNQENDNSDDKYILSVTTKSGNVRLFDNGWDIVEFYISTNKGESPKPLALTASGGEISRVMLSIKSIAADSENLPMLVFDEIDSGISGRIAQKVGFAMKKLARKHQIISITHLPQICALADKNIHVEKFETNGRTIISAHSLTKEEKLKETARLISGENITESSLKSARELVDAEVQ